MASGAGRVRVLVCNRSLATLRDAALFARRRWIEGSTLQLYGTALRAIRAREARGTQHRLWRRLNRKPHRTFRPSDQPLARFMFRRSLNGTRLSKTLPYRARSGRRLPLPGPRAAMNAGVPGELGSFRRRADLRPPAPAVRPGKPGRATEV